MRIDPKLVEEGYINVQKHLTLDYYIYNYSHLAQIKQHWVEDTRRCRGLILDGQGNVIARPFEKFHNIEEYGKGSKLGELPSYNSFQIFEKMDGSLGIVYPTPDGYVIATRGSFESDQSKVATEILRTKYAHVKFLPQYTYCFEIIYPKNRIVLDYGDMKDIVLLAIIDNYTGRDLDFTYVKNFAENNKLTVVKNYTTNLIGFTDDSKFEGNGSLQGIINHPGFNNKEGFVVLFDNGLRVKIKFEEYKKLHKLVFGLSTKSVWATLRSGQKIDDYLKNIPDEFYQWALLEASKLVAEYDSIEHYCLRIINNTMIMQGTGRLEEMKSVANYFKSCKYTSILFLMYKNKEYKDIIWRMLEPEFKRPFTGEEDET